MEWGCNFSRLVKNFRLSQMMHLLGKVLRRLIKLRLSRWFLRVPTLKCLAIYKKFRILVVSFRFIIGKNRLTMSDWIIQWTLHRVSTIFHSKLFTLLENLINFVILNSNLIFQLCIYIFAALIQIYCIWTKLMNIRSLGIGKNSSKSSIVHS